MRPRLAIPPMLAAALAAGCARHAEKSTQVTLAELRSVRPDVEDVKVEQGLDQAMQGYRQFLEDTPETAMTPEAIRRLADLQLEKQFGIHAGDGKPREMAAPERAQVDAPNQSTATVDVPWETEQEFEQRTTAVTPVTGPVTDPSGPLEAIALYDRLLAEYPSYENSDQVLYQKARAFDELGRTDEAIETMEQLIRANPSSEHYDEVQFRRAEYFFTRRRYQDAEDAYEGIIERGAGSEYYELALYKLGWTLYKREMYEDALHQYVALLDYKVSIGYDFDQAHEEDDERRVADTYRVISLSFNNLGGPDAVRQYFAEFGNRSYEDRIYNDLGEHYLAKLRYDDAAKTYRAFVALYPFHRLAPRFSMRVVETFTKGEFPKLVLESKREFAAKYGLQSEYWQHFEPAESPEVIAYLKTNLKDLATHYHAQYQGTEDGEEKQQSYREAIRWYGDYLVSFPTDADSPPINFQLADLLLEHEDFGQAAKQYEHTAYGYAPHERASAAGYAAVYAYREQLKRADESQRDAVKRDAIASSLRFADAFPDHEQAATILGAAADDLYGMQDYGPAVAAAQRVVDNYPTADPAVRRSAWVVVAHGSFELADYPRAEQAYAQVLAVTPESDATYAALVDNLAASIYKQGEAADQAQDYRAAADHFLRIRTAAPSSTIRAAAEYDAGAALTRLEDWTEAANVLEAFRTTYPDHEMNIEATRQIAHAYRESGQRSRAAVEYERLATQSDDPALRSEALLVSGDLYLESGDRECALGAYRRYVHEFPRPIEPALETRAKVAEIYRTNNDDLAYRQELTDIVRIDAEAGDARTGRTRTIAARSAQVLAEQLYREFVAVRLVQPFEESLQEKKRLMDLTIEALDGLVAYELADVTAAATFYMAETYLDFSRSLADSERPSDLSPADLAEYELVLEEEAFPFEEKAIAFHEKNLELLQAGVVGPWTEKSLDTLADLMPGRYARHEASCGFIGAIDTYVYRSPAQPALEPPSPGAVETSQLTPATVGNGSVEHETQQ